MYHYFVRRHVRKILRHLNEGDFDFIVRQFAPGAEHWFSGEHALAGGRHTHELIERWYRRLAAVFPGIRFQVEKLISSGSPWSTHVVAEWTDSFPLNKSLSANRGVFIMTLRWGRAVEFHVYCDTDGLKRNLSLLASQGLREAEAPAITDV